VLKFTQFTKTQKKIVPLAIFHPPLRVSVCGWMCMSMSGGKEWEF